MWHTKSRGPEGTRRYHALLILKNRHIISQKKMKARSLYLETQTRVGRAGEECPKRGEQEQVAKSTREAAPLRTGDRLAVLGADSLLRPE